MIWAFQCLLFQIKLGWFFNNGSFLFFSYLPHPLLVLPGWCSCSDVVGFFECLLISSAKPVEQIGLLNWIYNCFSSPEQWKVTKMVIYFFLLPVDSLIFTCLNILYLWHSVPFSRSVFPGMFPTPSCKTYIIFSWPSALKMSREMGNLKSGVCTYLTRKRFVMVAN